MAVAMTPHIPRTMVSDRSWLFGAGPSQQVRTGSSQIGESTNSASSSCPTAVSGAAAGGAGSVSAARVPVRGALGALRCVGDSSCCRRKAAPPVSVMALRAQGAALENQDSPSVRSEVKMKVCNWCSFAQGSCNPRHPMTIMCPKAQSRCKA